MAEKVIMPKQGLQMTEGTIIKWLVKEGGECKAGEPLFEMETDKLTITIDAPVSGTLLKIVRDEGETVPITEVIAVIGKKGEDISSILQDCGRATERVTVSSVQEVQGVFSTPRARMRAEENGTDLSLIKGSGPNGLVIERDVLSHIPVRTSESVTKEEIKTTPLARKVAEKEGVSVSEVNGTGSFGKITKADILTAVAARTQKTTVTRGIRVEPMTKMRSIIASRMVESLHTAAQLQHQVDCDMTEAGKLRSVFKKKGMKVSYNDIILMAASRALTEFPEMNASVDGETIIYHDYVNLGMAVAIDTGLVVPNIKNADLLRLEEISVISSELAEKAKNNTLDVSEMREGTFTVSNIGMLGIDAFTAIINPPESGILAVGRIRETPVVIDHEITIRPEMTITLTYDHRVTDGAPAAKFVCRIKELVENPMLML